MFISLNKRQKETSRRRNLTVGLRFVFLERESVWLLSKFPDDPTVEILRDKKEGRSRQ